MNAAQNPQAQPQATAPPAPQENEAAYWQRKYEALVEVVAGISGSKNALDAIKELSERLESVFAQPFEPVAAVKLQLTKSRQSNAALRGVNLRKTETIQALENELRETRLQCAILASNGAMQRTRVHNAPTVTETTIAANSDDTVSDPKHPFCKWVEKKRPNRLTVPEVGSPAALRKERVFQMEPPKELNT